MIDLENEFWNIRRAKLEKAFAQAAMDLMQHTQSGGMMIPVTGTTPQLFIMIGEAAQIVSMLPKQLNHDTTRPVCYHTVHLQLEHPSHTHAIGISPYPVCRCNR